MIGIVAAQSGELAVLAKRLIATRRRAVGALQASSGRIGAREVCLLVTGEGMLRAAEGVEALQRDPSLEALLGVGVAGGLSDGLTPGDVVVGRRVVAPDGQALEPPPWPWSDIDSPGKHRRGTVVTSETIVSTASAKRRLAERLGLEPPVVVDLESAAWARAAARYSLPWLIVRAVSDSIDEDLPLDFERFRKPDGSVSRPRAVAHAVTRPGLMLELDRLRRRVRLCAERLADAVEELVAC